MTRRLILASASPARLRVLQSAGLRADVEVSGVDEGGVDHLPIAAQVLALARRKAAAVAARIEPARPALVIGCDSLLEFEGRAEGKPGSGPDAVALWRRMRSRSGVLHTGHCLIDMATGSEVAAGDSAVIRFGDPTDAELDAYVATGEPQQVAGGFTLEGFGAAWIEGIDGNYGGITGLSIPVLRRLLRQLGIEIIDLWADRAMVDARSVPPDSPARRRPDPSAARPPEEFRARIEAVVAGLGPGEVVSYGDVAAEAGFPGAARAAGSVLAHPHPEARLPWWRVVTAAGRLVPGHEGEHARRLRAEGVEVVAGRVARPARPARPGRDSGASAPEFDGPEFGGPEFGGPGPGKRRSAGK